MNKKDLISQLLSFVLMVAVVWAISESNNKAFNNGVALGKQIGQANATVDGFNKAVEELDSVVSHVCERKH